MRRLTLVLVAIMPLSAFAVPMELSHQGRLNDALGAPLTGDHDLTFQFFDTETGGTELWTETLTVTFDDGYFSVDLGETSTLDASVFAGDDVWFTTTVDTGLPLPRTPFASVPFAIRAGHAATADNATTADSATSAGTANALAAGTIVDATELRIDGTTVIDSSGALVSAPAPAAHDHDADEVVTGTLSIDRIPVGTGATAVAAGNHGHDLSTLTGQLADSQLPSNMGSIVDGYVADGPLDLPSTLTLGTGGTCGSSELGQLQYASGALQLCTASGWQALLTSLPGGDPSLAGTDCAALRADGATTDGVYWIDPNGGSTADAYAVHCNMTLDGGGWTYVAEPGRSLIDPFDTFVETGGTYHDYVYDLRGMDYAEVLVVRNTDYWCNSWGTDSTYWGTAGGTSMGFAYDTANYHYHNGQTNPYRWIMQPYSISSSCSSCWTSNNTTDSDAAIVNLDGVGSQVKLTPPSGGNTHLEIMNFDAFVNTAGGCNLSAGNEASFSTWIR